MALHRSVQRDFLKSQAVVKKRRKKKMIKMSIRISLVVLLFVAFGLLSQIEFFSIKQVVISGNVHMTTEEVNNIVETSLNGKHLLLFSKRNGFLYQRDEIIENIQKAYPRVKNVKVYTESFSTLNVRIEERERTALWCSPIQCFEVDNTGYIFAELLPDESIDQHTVTFNGLEERIGSMPIGATVLDSEPYTEILSVANLMKEVNLPVKTVEFRSKDEVYFWIADTLGTSTVMSKRRVIFTTRKSYTEAFENLRAALKSDAFKQGMNFEYIDTRFGNKVFYRMSDIPEPATTTKKKR